ncbi:MAG TPA: neutral/alkaline non-lysosomal ceramidase N-terminal domain-containing protein [Candidatus Limnocylindrales bacterium]|nr:neutral/alkaline non-lysosomal ceramidase N-terminal domain-containing protein [Candidatus Limnocylindrales bacterium]
MRVGAARVEITPPLGCPMDGFETRTEGATGVHDPLYARCLVAEGADGERIALVVADLLQIDPGVQRVIASRVAESLGIRREHLQLAGTHTHSGPRVEPGSELEGTIGERIAAGVAEAWAGRREASVAVGVGTVTGIGANRRPGGGPVDDRVTVVRFDGADGAALATLVNYGCHPTTLGPDNYLYSADYPGVLCRELEARVGGLVMFTTGPQGDVNPGGYSPEGSMVGIVVPWRTFASAERYGRALAAVAADVHRTLAPEPAERVWGRSEVIALERKRLPDPTEARRAADAAAAAAAQVRAADLSADATYHAIVAAAYAELVAGQAASAPADAAVDVRISALAFGPFLHLGVSGELFVALGQRIREAVGADRTCIAALCDGTVGYIPTADAFEVGGYEPNASLLRPGEGERLADALVALAAGARSKGGDG